MQLPINYSQNMILMTLLMYCNQLGDFANIIQSIVLITWPNVILVISIGSHRD